MRCTFTRMANEMTARMPKNMPTNIMMSPAGIFFPTTDKPEMTPTVNPVNPKH
uniref:Uncharacterized protein n=1 Tax=Arion vulgaris TaxID=1028688 RepID=A0A0B7AAC5_9EUPU